MGTGRFGVSRLPRLGLVYDRSFPAGSVTAVARDVEDAGIDEFWVIEDCFFTTGVSLSAAALATTERIHVGLGIMPAVARTAAFSAMEIATLCNLAPGRFTPGIGHGVQDWMGQMGVRQRSPLGALDETISTVKRLLGGEEVTFSGQTVQLERVRLEQPPTEVPAVLAGVQQARSLELAGRVADGVILVEGAGPEYVSWALRQSARSADDFQVATFTILSVDTDRRLAYEPIAPFVAELVGRAAPALTALPFWDDLRSRVAAGGPESLLDMPADHWRSIGAIGTLDDAVAHFHALADAGVRVASAFPGPDPGLIPEQIETLRRVRSAG